ncbi:MAG: hypothetical protein AAGE01_10400 [Pseudomonadota bacterium]
MRIISPIIKAKGRTFWWADIGDPAAGGDISSLFLRVRLYEGDENGQKGARVPGDGSFFDATATRDPNGDRDSTDLSGYVRVTNGMPDRSRPFMTLEEFFAMVRDRFNAEVLQRLEGIPDVDPTDKESATAVEIFRAAAAGLVVNGDQWEVPEQ